MQYNLGLVSRLQPPLHFMEQKNFFQHDIGVDEREGIDKKNQQKMTYERGHANSSMFFVL